MKVFNFSNFIFLVTMFLLISNTLAQVQSHPLSQISGPFDINLNVSGVNITNVSYVFFGNGSTDTYLYRSGTNTLQTASTLAVPALSLGWGNLTAFPSGCSAGQFVTTIGSTLTCATASSVGWTVSGFYLYNNTSTASIGIGTSIPVTKLDVQNTTGALLNVSHGTTARLYVDSSGRIGAGTASPLSTLDISGNLSVTGSTNSSIDGSTLFIDATNNRIGIGTNLVVGTTLNVSGLIAITTLSSCDTIDTTANGTLICGSDAAGGGWTASGSNLYNNTAGVQVGIGTSTPGATLNITSTNNAGALDIVNGTTGTHLLFVNATTGNVGIGTTGAASPPLSTFNWGSGARYLSLYTDSGAFASSFQIADNTTVSTQSVGAVDFLNVNNADANASTNRAIATIAGTVVTSNSNANKNSGGNLLFYTKADTGSLTERMRIDSTGNVGIGTTSPASLLNVRGTGTQATGRNDVQINGTGTIGAGIDFNAEGAGGRIYSIFSLATVGANVGKLAFFDVTEGAYRMVIDSAGNVGIGTTSPTQKLDVVGNISVSGTINKGPTNPPLFRWLPIGTMTNYTNATTSDLTTDIAFDGTNMWTTHYSGTGTNYVTKISPTGIHTIYSGTGSNSYGGIAFDGTNMWTANYGDSSVTRVAPNGSMTNFTGVGPNPYYIAFDGTNMWTTIYGNSSVTKINRTGGMTNYGGTVASPYGIAFDGTNMWTANFAANSVTKITPSGTMTNYTGNLNGPIDLAFDGTNMWVSNYNTNYVTKVAPDGTMTNYAGTLSTPFGIAFDGTNMWTTSFGYNGLGVTKILVITG